jgi:UDP-N-acetylmuramyl tripeptide synthase
MVDEPHGAIWGGVVAAPAFAQIAAYDLQYLEVPPDNVKPGLASRHAARASGPGARPGRVVNAARSRSRISPTTRAPFAGRALLLRPRLAVDGHDLAADAVARGAAALVVERRLELAVPQLVVADSRRAMARRRSPSSATRAASSTSPP